MLFSPQTKNAAQDPAAALKAAARKSAELKAADLKAAAIRAATPAPARTSDANLVRITPESIAAAEAAVAKWEAGEQKFEQDNGFRREANSMIKGMYAQAKTGQFGTALVNTRTDMNDLVDRFFTGFQSDVTFINQSGGDLTVGATYRGPIDKGLDAQATAVFQAERQDHLDARRMTLFAETAYVTKSLGLSKPLVSQNDGQVTFSEQDITLNGKAFAHIRTDGSLTRLSPNIAPNHPDPEGTYTAPLNLRV